MLHMSTGFAESKELNNNSTRWTLEVGGSSRNHNCVIGTVGAVNHPGGAVFFKYPSSPNIDYL